MPGMPNDQAKKLIIKEHMKQQEEDAGGKDRLRMAKLTIKGRTDFFPIYRFKLDDLAFNKANGRIKSEVLEKEADLGRMLDQFDQDDSKIIMEILTSIRRDENDKIKADLKKNTQINPGIITVDGIVINGNRRKALLQELFDETHDEKYGYLDVHVLPSDITKSELWLIEAGIQLSTPQQLDYSPINHLLKLSEGINSGLKIPDMAARIYGVTEEQLENDLKRLNLINDYLNDFLGKSGKYYLVKNLNEHFINLQNIMDWANRPRGPVRRDWIPTIDDINELKLVGFYYIRMKIAHLRIRDLRDLFSKSDAWKELRRALSVDSNLSEEERKEFSISPSPSVETSNENEDPTDVYETSSVSEKKDIQEETVWREKRQNQLKSFYQDAKEQQQIIEDSSKPLTLAQRALKNIQAISLDNCESADPEIDKILGEIILLVNKIRKKVKK